MLGGFLQPKKVTGAFAQIIIIFHHLLPKISTIQSPVYKVSMVTFGCNVEVGLVIPKSHIFFHSNNMKLPIESSAQFVATNPNPDVDSKS